MLFTLTNGTRSPSSDYLGAGPIRDVAVIRHNPIGLYFAKFALYF